MKKLTRNLILPAAALAALVLAPTSRAQGAPHDRGEDRERVRHGERWDRDGGHVRGQWEGRWHGHPYRPYWSPPYPAYRHAGRYRVYSGYRFYGAYPGPGFVYVTGFGWALPPFYGAVWVPGHYDVGGFWIGGYWR